MPPEIIETPVDVTVDEGSPAKFEAIVQGKPMPDISWYHEERLIKPSKYFVIEVSPHGEVSLTITSAYPEDAGQYTLLARNSAGETACTFQVEVIPGEHTAPPYFIRPLINLEVIEGDSVVLEAEIGGNPEPSAIWLHNGMDVTTSPDYKVS